MCNVILKDGTTVQAYFVFYQTPPQLHIYPVNMSIGEIYSVFDDPEATETITVESDTGETKTYQNYTELFSVQRSPYHPEEKEYLVWLQRPYEKP